MKRLFILLLVCIMTAVSFVPSFAAFNTSGDSSALVLKGLGVLNGDENGNLKLDDLVTRAEFAKIAVMSSEHKNKVSPGIRISVFPDCTADHWASPYVIAAVENGLVEGYSNATFGPEDNITYAQAVTVALRLLGYTDEDFGNTWPEGQLAMAGTLKLDASVNKTRDEYMTRRDIATLIVNTLGTNKKASNAEYINSLGYSILNDCLIVATEAESSFVNNGKILTSDGEYDVSDEILSYVKTGDKGDAIVSEEGRLVAFVSYGYKVSESCVYSAGSDLTSVYANGSVTSLDCDSQTACYRNGQKTTYANVKSSLSAGDKIYITRGKDSAVDSLIIGESDFKGPVTIYGNTDWKKILGVSENYDLVRNSAKASEDDLTEYDIVYYSEGLSTVFVYNKKVSGIYTSASPNADSPEKITVSGKEYAIETASAFAKLRPSGGAGIGDNIVLLLGRNGEVADVIAPGGYVPDDYDDALAEVTPASDFASQYALLAELSAIELTNGELAGANITRGEFARMAVMSSSYRSSVSAGAKLSVFADCPYTHPASPYVRVAAEKSIMSAYSDSTFRPDEPVTVADAADALLKVLGYTNDDFGYSWPSGQMSLAASLGITDGISKGAYDTVTKAEAALMTYNMLGTKMKSSAVTCIENMGYNYYEDTVIIATSKQNTSVGSGKVMTSEGTFNIDESVFDYSLVGKKGDMLANGGKLIMFNESENSYGKYIVYSVVSGGIAVMDGGEIKSISLSDSSTAYANASQTTFAGVKSSLAVGDTLTVCYDASLRPEYIYIDASSLKGPYVSKGSSAVLLQIPDAHSNSAVVRNGKQADMSAILVNDILYYSSSLDTVYAYSQKVTGVFEGASPSQDSPDTVTVSGVSYKLEGADAVTAFSAAGSIEYGDTISLCLGRSGDAAYAYSLNGTSLVGYLVSTGIKSFTNSNGEVYTAMAAELVLPDGSTISCHTSGDYSSWINKIMSVTFTDDGTKMAVIGKNETSFGTVDAANMKVGSYKLADNVNILDVGYNSAEYPTIYTSVFPQRIDGITLSGSNVLYCKAENNEITDLILLDATGDAFSYGIITSAQTNITDRSSSGSYTCNIGGSTYSYSGGAYTNIRTGSIVKTAIESGRTSLFTVLTSKSASVSDISYTEVSLSSGETLRLADDVCVYKINGVSTYTVIPLSEIVENTDNYGMFTLCSDKAEKNGGRVRIIMVKQK